MVPLSTGRSEAALSVSTILLPDEVSWVVMLAMLVAANVSIVEVGALAENVEELHAAMGFRSKVVPDLKVDVASETI